MSLIGLTSRRDDATSEDAKYDHEIQLVDHTCTDDDDQAPTASSSGTQTPISTKPSQRLTRGSLREDLAKRGLARHKYAKWQQERVTSTDEGSASGELVQLDSKQARAQTDEADQSTDASDSQGRFSRTQSRLERGRKRVKGLLNSKKAIKQAKEEDAAIDVLYENQRGSFFFGIPLFSSKSLLNFDPASWVNGKYKPSPVNITNAQVPDPSWEWAWKSWYVDMSYDVDEEGWQYSFSFQRGLAWHGTHPWFHSFVRRRRWLRKRVRKHAFHNGKPDPKHMSEAHMLNADYFTIHPKKRDTSRHSSAATSLARSRSFTRLQKHGEIEDEVDEDIRDIPTLMKHLKKASIDREKIVHVRRFMDQGGEELHYLAEQMPVIMSLFIFQSSRRQLLVLLLRRFDAASAHRREHQSHHQRESSPEARKIDSLLAALRVADEQCRMLEYWSDIRSMVKEGNTLGAVDEDMGWGHSWHGVDEDMGWGHSWHGVDDSGPAEADESALEKFKEDGWPAHAHGEFRDDAPEEADADGEANGGHHEDGSAECTPASHDGEDGGPPEPHDEANGRDRGKDRDKGKEPVSSPSPSIDETLAGPSTPPSWFEQAFW